MSQTADRYSKALFELAKEQNTLEAVQNSFTDIRNLILNLEEFRHFLNNPLLTYEERCVVIKSLFEGRVPDLCLRFLLFITYKSRLDILKSIIESFDSMYLLTTRQMRAYVTTALPAENADRVLISQRLRDKFQNDMLIQWKTNPALIGGFRIFVQGKIYDYSFKEQLNHFYQLSTQPA